MGYQLIETIEVGSSVASITFSSIPQNGVDLLLVYSGRSDRANEVSSATIYINGVGAFTPRKELIGTGSSVTDGAGYVDGATGANATSNTFGSEQIYIPNYTGSQNKTASVDAVTENNATRATQVIAAYGSTITDAVTSITIDEQSTSNLVQYSTASLYIITAD